jgi:alkylhydroperoxidase family enzyme
MPAAPQPGVSDATIRGGLESNVEPLTELQHSTTMPARTLILFAAFLSVCAAALPAQELPPAQTPQTESEKLALLERVIANQKKNDEAQSTCERLERLEARKGPPGTPPEIKFSRAIPAGTGVDRIPVGPDGKPVDPAAYRAELEKLEHALVWAAEDGRAQHDAYEKIAKKQKDRAELIEATRTAFLFSFIAREPRGDRMLAKYRMEPNPAYKASSRSTAMFAKVRGFVWIDEAAAQLARVEVEVTDDISIGGFLAKVYKGSHLMQERYEMLPGTWLASYSQYDFDGRRLFVSFAVHERTFYSQYRRIGPPKEALFAIRAELGKPGAANADP